MTKRLDTFRQYIDTFGKGLAQEVAPEVAGGILLELFHLWQVDTVAVIKDVTNNTSLWDRLGQKQRDKLKTAAQRVGNLDWANADWVINAIKKDYPGVASLILGWPEAYTWLEEQVEELKKILEE